jgi:hypothetical protein
MYGSVETMNIGSKPLTLAGQCACGYRGRVGDWRG